METMKNKTAGGAGVCGLALVLALVALSGAGCQKAIDKNDLVKDPSMTSTNFESRMDFWHTLATDRICSNDEAFYGLMLYMEKGDQAKTYTGRVNALKSLGMLPDGFDGKADEAVTRGTLAVAVVRLLEIKGGLIQHIFPKTERYSTRELVWEGIYPPSTPNQVFSGAEFVGIIGRIEDYQRMAPKQAQVVASGSGTLGHEGSKPGMQPASAPAGPEAGKAEGK